MPPVTPLPSSSRLFTVGLPLAIWLLGVLGSVLAYRSMDAIVRREARLDFDRMAERLSEVIVNRVKLPLYGMKGARGAFAAEMLLNRAHFRAYVDSRDLPMEFPGALGFGFIERVDRAQLAEFEARERADGALDFVVQSTGDAATLYVIKYLDPLAGNRAMWGLDLGSFSDSRNAVERAIRTGEPAITQRVRWTMEDGERDVVLLILPVYHAHGELLTPSKRDENLVGLVLAPLDPESLFTGLSMHTEGMLDFELFEGGATTQSQLLYDDDRHLDSTDDEVVDHRDYAGRMFEARHEVSIGGTSWTARFSTTPRFEATHGNGRSWQLGLSCAAGSTLLAVLVWALTRSRDKAITLANKITASLQASEAAAKRLSLVASRTSNAVIVCDCKGRIEWVNDGFVKITGFSPSEALGRTPGSLLQGPDTDPTTVARMRAAIAARTGFKEVIVNYTKDRRPYWIEAEVQPIYDDSGSLSGFMAIETEVTERVEAEKAIQQAMEVAQKSAYAALEANMAKSQFLATMSHEIRTPMNGVIGMTSLLFDTSLSAEQREFVETIRQSGDTLLTLINDILDYSKIEAGKMQLEHEAFNLRECIEGTMDVLAPRAAEKKLDLLYDIADGTPACVRGDCNRLRQIIMNLAGNAIKFTRTGEVLITVAPRNQTSDRVELVFCVADTGIGIPAEAQQKLFQSFTQVDSSTTRKYGGTGLGLAICKRLAELMGGAISLESELGRGTRFHFSLPMEISQEQPERAPRHDGCRLDGRRLLIVDDNKTALSILSELAGRWGLTVVTASSGESALAKLREGAAFDAAILDLYMPEMDGVELAQAIKAMPAHARTPLILLSSMLKAEQPDDPQLFAARLSKPVKPSQIYDLLAPLLFRDGAWRPAIHPAEGTPPGATVGRSERILLAEDNAVNQKVAFNMLARLGYPADIVSNGIEVMEAVRRRPYDIVLMDVQMPEMDGLNATRAIHRERPLRGDRPWIIALTANAMTGDREVCMEAGMDDYLAKPIKLPELKAALARAVLPTVNTRPVASANTPARPSSVPAERAI